jgi:hypothetical protein
VPVVAGDPAPPAITVMLNRPKALQKRRLSA